MSKLRVIVADDHAALRHKLVLHLSCEFGVLDAVADGSELVNSALLLNPDVIVSDISMPQLTGLEAMNELSARGLSIPFVFISAGENMVEDRASFVAKIDLCNEIIPAIYTAASGRIYVSRGACSNCGL